MITGLIDHSHPCRARRAYSRNSKSKSWCWGKRGDYSKFSIIIRSAPNVTLLLNRILLRSGETVRPKSMEL